MIVFRVISFNNSEFQVVVEKSHPVNTVHEMAEILESSDRVKFFYVEGMSATNQQAAFNLHGYKKWFNVTQG